ncbi:MAG: PepSY-associated TM helix domain-containing protein [Azospirillaceae bacterium]|nr:PepSY-associated TM helix domain-containing protein [Azospirillaceae bacterium]
MSPRSSLSSTAVRRWSAVHTWTSLACTLFLLLICVTGLPLVFWFEIADWLTPHTYARLPADTPPASLDRITDLARARYPGQVVMSVFTDDDEPQVYVWMAPGWDQVNTNPRVAHLLRFDARTAEVVEDQKPLATKEQTFLGLMLSLHRDLFMGLKGELFMGAMALLFLAAIISGIVLYGPYTRKLDFGTVRAGRSTRVRWLDLHNLLGVTTLAWALVVGATGVINELTTPMFATWQRTDVRAMVVASRTPSGAGQATSALTPTTGLSSIDAAYATAARTLPDMRVMSAIYPGSSQGTPDHYLVWTKGATPLTARLFSPMLIDARTGELTTVLSMPWYLRALEISRPLHFGDYGGLPLKALWALLDLVTIAVLGSGLYLWLARRRGTPATAAASPR